MTFYFLARNCPATGIIHLYMRPTEVEENNIKPKGSSQPKHTIGYGLDDEIIV
jgi:hypothetical protein